MIQQDIEKWIKNDWITSSSTTFIQNASSQTIENLFENQIEFGTGGMRGLIGPGPNRINSVTIGRATAGYADYLLNEVVGTKKSVIIGYDNRMYSREFALLAGEILSAKGIKAFVFDKLTATPVLSYSVRIMKAVGGIMITASHNPKEYNGFKIYDSTGCQFLPDEVAKVKRYIDEYNEVYTFEQSEKSLFLQDETLEDRYVSEFESFTSTEEKNLTIGYSPHHGTGGRVMKKILSKYGFTKTIFVNEQYPEDPEFTNSKNPNPESPDAFDLLIEYGKKNDLDLLLTTDPDADRLGAYYRDKDMNYVRLTGNSIGAILCLYIIENSNPEDLHYKYIVKSIVSSNLGRCIADKYGVESVEVLTGFKYIGDVINQKGSKNFLLGYEESFGYLFNPITRDKDGVQVGLLLAVIANKLKTKNKTLGDYLDEIYKTHGYYYEDLISIELDPLNWKKQSENFFEVLKKDFSEFSSIIEDYEMGVQLNKMTNEYSVLSFPREKVIKYSFYDNTWLCIRPSGTEPKFKIYIGVTDSKDCVAKAKMTRLTQEVNSKMAFFYAQYAM